MTSQDRRPEEEPPRRRREPVFQLPTVLVVLVGLLVAIQIGVGFLSPWGETLVTAWFAFIPDRVILDHGQPAYPGGWGAIVWTFLTHALLHGGWVHLGFNAAMLTAIGRAVLDRLDVVRFLAFLVFVTVAGAATHLVVEWGSGIPMVGASGAVSGLLGGMMRFLVPTWDGRPASIGATLADSRVRGIVAALVVMNVVLVVVGTGPFGGGDAGVAWAVHMGGFVAGLLGIGWFRRRRDGSA